VCDDPHSTRVSATLELPGIPFEEMSIVRQGDRLIVSGERRSPLPEDTALAASKYPVQEFKYGRYRRVIDLSPGTQASTLAVSLKDGLFVVSWPRAAAVPVAERDRIEPRRSPPEG